MITTRFEILYSCICVLFCTVPSSTAFFMDGLALTLKGPMQHLGAENHVVSPWSLVPSPLTPTSAGTSFLLFTT
jgi:hypothetical protein